MVQIEIRRRDRRVSHPGLDGHHIDPASEPQTGCGVPEVVNPPALRRLRPSGYRLRASKLAEPLRSSMSTADCASGTEAADVLRLEEIDRPKVGDDDVPGEPRPRARSDP
jgi:hypothetical protein